MDMITVTAAIVAVVESVKMTFPKVTGLYTMLVAIALGAVAGYFHVEGTAGVFAGILIGIAAVGVHTVASAAAGK